MLPRHGMTEDDIAEVQRRYGLGPHVAVDLVIVSVRWDLDPPQPVVLLIERGNLPYRGYYALPGGFVDLHEDLETAVRRELAEETGLTDLGHAAVEQLHTFGDPRRDPRSRVISVVHLALVRWDDLGRPQAGDDARQALFMELRDGLPVDGEGNPLALAFDHERVLSMARERLRVLACFSSAPLSLLPARFSLDQAEYVFGLLRGTSAPRGTIMRWLTHEGWVLPSIEAGMTPSAPTTYRATVGEPQWASPCWPRTR
jgi:8-oxo-dGTP diphosphatase